MFGQQERKAVNVHLAILLFGAVIIGLEIWRMEKGWSIASTRIVGLTLVIIAAMFLSLQGLSSETQVAAALGLLGTVAGYLLGKEK
jgi:hypothetical protein